MPNQSTVESKATTQNGVKRLIFCALAILLQLLFWILLFMRLSRYTQVIEYATRIFGLILVLVIYSQNKTASLKMPCVYMNAGAYGGELGQIVDQVEIMDDSGNIHCLSREEMHFSYRHSRMEEESAIVLSATFALTPKPEAEIRAVMKELMGKRTASQPLDLPSAGSAFKRPVGGYAAALIDEAGLRGYRVGGAAISEKHTGFAVNLGDATARDVRNLLEQVSNIVYERSGVRLEPEVRIW